MHKNKTPFFPAWRPRLAPMGSRLESGLSQLRRCTLSQLEAHFGSCVPETLFPKARKKQNSRDRIYTQKKTFWLFTWQAFNPKAACREVVRQVQALHCLLDKKQVNWANSAYCRARKRLPKKNLTRALEASASAAQGRAGKADLLQGRPVKVVDGTFLTLADTKTNRKDFPAFENGTQNTSFPQIRMVALFCLASGAILKQFTGSKHSSEMGLLRRLMRFLKSGDIVLADQGFGNFVVLALLAERGVDLIARSSRRVDCRQGKKLGKNDCLVAWERISRGSAIVSKRRWKKLSRFLTVRVVRGQIAQKGFRVREMTLVTTLLDPQKYPTDELLRAYLRRWRMEMCLDDLKTTLQIEQLRCKSPAMVQRELLVHLIAHNLIRCLMAEAAQRRSVEMERISFKGALDGFREFSQAISQTRGKAKKREAWLELLKIIAEDLVPERPGRREPRAIKRIKHKYPRMSRPRCQFKDRMKRNTRRTLRNAALAGLK